MLAFLGAVFLLLITPGPGVLSTAGVGAAFGARAGLRYVAGLCLGTNLVALAVVSGLAALMLAAPTLRTVLLVASVGYIAWLAARVAFSGTDVRFAPGTRAPGVRAALLLQAINPKAYVVNTALFTGFPFDGATRLGETLWKFALVNAAWIPIHLAWLGAGIGLRRLDPPPRVQRAINVAMAGALLAVVALALLNAPTGTG